MSATVKLTPLCPEVQVYLGDAEPVALELLEMTVDALRRAGKDVVAAAFLEVAESCDSEAELIDLIRCTVTLI